MITVYTCITDGFGDILYDPLIVEDGIEYFCFTNKDIKSNVYKILPLPYNLDNDRRNSRFPKINSHIVFPQSEVTIWHDGVYQIKSIKSLLKSLKSDWSFCTFKHSSRKSVTEEIRACCIQKKENPNILNNQYKSYISEGFNDNCLFENSCLIRKNNSIVKDINNLWWSEYQKWSCRDQISLPYVFWKLDYKDVTLIEGKRFDNDFFKFREHK